MQFDNGEVLQDLHKSWTFLGANMMEWASGLVVFLLISLFGESPVRVMPFMLLGCVGTAYSLASLRMMFPDEERGVRNAVMSSLGFKPVDIPAPSNFQPVWSGAPLIELPENWRFTEMGLDQLYPTLEEQLMEEDE